MLQPLRKMEKDGLLLLVVAHCYSTSALMHSCALFSSSYRNGSCFRGFLILCTVMSLSEIYTLICFQHKNRYSIPIGNRKLLYFSRLYFLFQGVRLKFHPSVFHMSQLSLQNLYFRFRCHINQHSHVLFVIIFSSKSNIIFQSVEVSRS